MAQRPDETACLLLEVARKISGVYLYFAERFPEERALWLSLGRDEESHIKLAEKLIDCVHDGKISFDDCMARNLTLSTIIHHIDNLDTRAHDETFSYFDALFFARDFERSLIIKDVFCNIPGLGKEEAHLLAKLHDDTASHVELLDDKWWHMKSTGRH